MAYQINKTDGTILTTLADGQIDQVSTDITLIGKNYSGFGEALNENLVKMLENFSNSSEPEKPIRGQLWFDTRDLKLKVYIGNQFVPVSSAILSRTQPATLAAGDLWYDETRGQLFFFDGSALKLLGPDWSTSQGQSGLVTGNVFDNANNTRVIVYLYCGGVLLGIFSKDAFTPRSPIPGFTGSLVPGFNISSVPNAKFNVKTSDSEKLGGEPATSYVRSDINSVINGSLGVKSNLGITVGELDQLSFSVNESGTTDFNVKRSLVNENFLTVNSNSRTINFYYNENSPPFETPSPFFNFGGSVKIFGDIEWTGSANLTNLNQVNVIVEDKNIILANPTSIPPSNELADGGGIILKGTYDHEFLWTEETFAWNSSEHINLVSSQSVPNPEYKIDGVTVISKNSLGSSITSAPGITNFGIQNFIETGKQSIGGPLLAVLRLEGTRIQVLETNGNLELQANGTGNISLIGSPRIIGLSNPIQSQDAATKNYVDNKVDSKSIIFSIDLTDDKDNDYIIENILNNLAPTNENISGTVARILCTVQTNLPSQADVNSRLNLTTSVFNTPSGTGQALTGISINPVSVPGSVISISRIIKIFRITQGQWTFISSQVLP